MTDKNETSPNRDRKPTTRRKTDEQIEQFWTKLDVSVGSVRGGGFVTILGAAPRACKQKTLLHDYRPPRGI